MFYEQPGDDVFGFSSPTPVGQFAAKGGRYWLFGSGTTGWDPNPIQLFRGQWGASLADPQWERVGNPTGSSSSFNTQPAYVVRSVDSFGKPFFVYLGDNWIHASGGGLENAGYAWIPFQVMNGTITMEKEWAGRDEWDVRDPFLSGREGGDFLSLIKSNYMSPISFVPADQFRPGGSVSSRRISFVPACELVVQRSPFL